MPRVQDWVERDHYIARISGDSATDTCTVRVYDRASGTEVPVGDEQEADNHKAARQLAMDLLAQAAGAGGNQPAAAAPSANSEPPAPDGPARKQASR